MLNKSDFKRNNIKMTETIINRMLQNDNYNASWLYVKLTASILQFNVIFRECKF